MLFDPITCLAMAIYLESGNQPLIGKIAVAHVIMNRVKSKRYPNNICPVVTQKHQFSFYWDGKKEQIPTYNSLEIKAWLESKQIAEAFLAEGGNGNQFEDITNRSLHYARKDIQKDWMYGMMAKQIGDHVFYY